MARKNGSFRTQEAVIPTGAPEQQRPTTVRSYSTPRDWINGTREMPVGTPEWCSLATDKIEGLTTDLRMAVQVAWRRGAKEWARANYPGLVPWLKSCDEVEGA